MATIFTQASAQAEAHWTTCPTCKGRGKKSKGIRKKAKLRYQRELQHFQQNPSESVAPTPPKGHLFTCLDCQGSGLVVPPPLFDHTPDTNNYPHLAIIGGGIGGVALAVACLHRQIPFTLYERDSGFESRSQGYGLTLQQASKEVEGLGLFSLEQGVISTRHLVHTPEGKVVGEWGARKLRSLADKSPSKRTNIHIARQSLRLALLQQLGESTAVKWGHQLVDFKESTRGDVALTFQVENERELQHAKADLVIGADGIRSTVRRLLLGQDTRSLRYLDCIVILGICPLDNIQLNDACAEESSHTLLDSATVFQTANGNERIYVMPYDEHSVMWQLSFPMLESDAKALSAKGPQALKDEAIKRCQWHDPIPQLLAATQTEQVSGYPVYDRALLQPEHLAQADQSAHATLIGDAAHPMSPFKGQGANQALLDALALARGIKEHCWSQSEWREKGIRHSVLTAFETDMLERSAVKVQDSAEAAEFLHTDSVLHESDGPRGRRE